MAYSKEIEELIEDILADGVFDDKERIVIRKKAQQNGIDPDEIEIIVDGRLKRQYNKVEESKQKLRKCPSCGRMIPAMTAVCVCGVVIDTHSPDNIALHKYMNELEMALIKFKRLDYDDLDYYSGRETKAKLESLIRQGKTLYEGNSKITDLIIKAENTIHKYESERNSKWRLILGVLSLIVENIKVFAYFSLVIVIMIAGVINLPYTWVGCSVYVAVVAVIGLIIYHIIDDNTNFFL